MVFLDYTAGRCCLYRAMVRNELPISGLDSTDVYIYKGALLPVELSRGHPQIVVCSSPGRADHTYLDIVATPSVQATCCQMVHSLFYSTDYSQAIACCCLYRAMVRVIYLYVVYPTHCHARLGEQYNCDSIQVTINGATSRCQWACHQCLPNTLASYMFWSPPIVVHH